MILYVCAAAGEAPKITFDAEVFENGFTRTLEDLCGPPRRKNAGTNLRRSATVPYHPQLLEGLRVPRRGTQIAWLYCSHAM